MHQCPRTLGIGPTRQQGVEEGKHLRDGQAELDGEGVEGLALQAEAEEQRALDGGEGDAAQPAREEEARAEQEPGRLRGTPGRFQGPAAPGRGARSPVTGAP